MSKPAKEDLFVFIDIETTGLSPKYNTILEIAWKAVLPTGRCLAESQGINFFTPFPVEETSQYVLEMHEKSGLMKDISVANEQYLADKELAPFPIKSHLRAMIELEDYVKYHQDHFVFYWAGFSVHFDLGFLEEKRLLNPTFDKFSHRRLDLSPFKMVAKHCGIDLTPVEAAHRAMADVDETILVYKKARHLLETARPNANLLAIR